MGPSWVLSAPDGPHIGPMNLAIRDYSGPVCHKQLSVTWTSNYTLSLLWDVITCPCPGCLLLGHKFFTYPRILLFIFRDTSSCFNIYKNILVHSKVSGTIWNIEYTGISWYQLRIMKLWNSFLLLDKMFWKMGDDFLCWNHIRFCLKYQ